MNLRARALNDVFMPALDVLRGRSLSRVLDELDSTQWWPRHILVAQQEVRLRQLVAHAYAHVPYYREVMDSRGISPADIQTVADLSKFPVLARGDVRALSRYARPGVPVSIQ